MRLLTTAVIGAALLTPVAGCGGDDGSPAPGQPDTIASAIAYQRGGGFAASPLELTLGADGRARLTTGIPDDRRRTQFTLSEDESSELQELARAADLPALAEEEHGPTGCADCYSYSVKYDGALVERDETEVSGAFGALVARLGEIADEHGG
jgi:hypothetical protein